VGQKDPYLFFFKA